MGDIRGPFVDSDLLPSVPGLTPPTLEPRTYYLIDDDERVCRVISDDERDDAFVDLGIKTFRLRNVNLLTLDVDRETVDLVYNNGTTAALRLGSIDLRSGSRAEQYGKTNGVIYPLHADGAFMFNGTNTPHLVAMRRWYLAEAKRVNDQRIEIAEVVHNFAQIIGQLGQAGDVVR